MDTPVAVVLGTYNRRELLEAALGSVRNKAGVPVHFFVTDGGSTDGSREWLAAQPDVTLFGQRGPLSGAVRAFNLAFGGAVDAGCPYVMNFNDDAVLLTDDGLKKAVDILEADPGLGAVAFEFDLRRNQKFERIHDRVYPNFGLSRRVAGEEVARMQGDPEGRRWWNPIYKTYGADCEFACWLWKLGWRIYEGVGIQIRDVNCQDALRKQNEADNPNRTDSKLFWDRWILPETVMPARWLNRAEKRAPVVWDGARVHLGCGDKHLSGWVNVDGQPNPAADLVGEALAVFRSIPRHSLTEIYTSHFIEHLPPDNLPELLSLMKNALKPGGFLRVATIDFPGIYHSRYMTAANGSAWNSALYGETQSTDHPYAAHRQAFDQASLQRLFLQAGFLSAGPFRLQDHGPLWMLNDYAKSCQLVTVLVEGQA